MFIVFCRVHRRLWIYCWPRLRLRRIRWRSRRAWSGCSRAGQPRCCSGRTGQPRCGSGRTSCRKRGCFWTARWLSRDCRTFRKDHSSRKRLRRRRPRRIWPRSRPLVTHRRAYTITTMKSKKEDHTLAHHVESRIPFLRRYFKKN